MKKNLALALGYTFFSLNAMAANDFALKNLGPTLESAEFKKLSAEMTAKGLELHEIRVRKDVKSMMPVFSFSFESRQKGISCEFMLVSGADAFQMGETRCEGYDPVN